MKLPARTHCRDHRRERLANQPTRSPPATPLTRARCSPATCFFAVKGEHLDGHDYVNCGAGTRRRLPPWCTSARRRASRDQGRIIAVPDTLDALQTAWPRRAPHVEQDGDRGHRLGGQDHHQGIHRRACSSAKYHVLKSEGNLNNHYGLPLQLLRLEPEHELAVVELGMNHAGEIRALAALCEPNVGVVTCVAPVHLGFFNSVADIARAKYELIQALPATGTAVLNADDEYVSQFGRDFSGRVITFGINHPADVRADAIREMGPDGSRVRRRRRRGARARASLPLIGRHNVYNALAAIAVGAGVRAHPGGSRHRAWRCSLRRTSAARC